MSSVGVTLAAVHTLWAGRKFGGFLGLSSLAIDLSAVGHIIVDDGLASLVLLHLTFDGLGIDGVTGITGVDAGLDTSTLAGVRLHDLLVLAEGLSHLLVRNVVEEDTLAERAWYCGTELAITSLDGSQHGILALTSSEYTP